MDFPFDYLSILLLRTRRCNHVCLKAFNIKRWQPQFHHHNSTTPLHRQINQTLSTHSNRIPLSIRSKLSTNRTSDSSVSLCIGLPSTMLEAGKWNFPFFLLPTIRARLLQHSPWAQRYRTALSKLGSRFLSLFQRGGRANDTRTTATSPSSSSGGSSSTSTDRRVDDGLMQCSYCHSDSVEVMAILSETTKRLFFY